MAVPHYVSSLDLSTLYFSTASAKMTFVQEQQIEFRSSFEVNVKV